MLSNIFNQPKQTPVYPAIFVWFKQFNTISDAEKPNKKTTMKTLHTTIQNSARCRNMQDRSNAGIYLNSDAANSWKTNLKPFFNFPKTALCNFSQNQHPTVSGIAPHYTAVVVLHPFFFHKLHVNLWRKLQADCCRRTPMERQNFTRLSLFYKTAHFFLCFLTFSFQSPYLRS